ncbi:MAG: outer membrane protein assembly factor BamE [Bdellovibrio sp.]|nr:outer membrane protein assembly factor BamE [Bdellovibrio sp.]
MLRLMSIPVVVLGLLTSACQTSMLKEFNELKPGMEKDDVLSHMGSPNQTQRFHGKDRWYYVFYDKDMRFEKEVHFFEGNAIYIGDTWQPPEDKSAYAADNSFAAKNKAIDEQMLKDVEAHRNAYENYEAKARGEDKVRYVPKFEPIR